MKARTLRWNVIALLTVVVGTAARPASAQSPADAGSGLLLGPLTVRPMFTVRDAGWDSNVFNTPGEAAEDHVARIGGSADAWMRLGAVRIEGTGSAEYLYFQRYTQERAINRAFSTRLQPQLSGLSPFVGIGYRRTRDRASSEIDVMAPRTEHEHSAGLEAKLSTRGTLQGSVRRAHWRFDEGERFRDVDLPRRLNRRSDTAQLSFRYELTPLTTFTVGSAFIRDRFTDSPDRNADTVLTEVGLLFAPDAVLRGRALVGYREMRPRGPIPIPSRGPTAGVQLSYTLLDRTVLSGRLMRESTVSVESNPFYLSTLGAVEVSHNLIGPLDVIARAGRERLDYDAVPAFRLPAHLDRVTTVGGGVTLRLGPRVRMSANYEKTTRRSDALDDRNYDRQRLYTTATYGF
jgi:hypothetical protein